MKTFMYTLEKTYLKNNTFDIIFSVYHIRRNQPEYLGFLRCNSGYYKGNITAVVNWLVNEKCLPKKALNKDGYYDVNELNESYKLYEV